MIVSAGTGPLPLIADGVVVVAVAVDGPAWVVGPPGAGAARDADRHPEGACMTLIRLGVCEIAAVGDGAR